MKLLLHTCCGPCLIYPLKVLREQGWDITGYFYNPNIHPYQEYKKRLLTLQEFARSEGVSMVYEDDYRPEDYLRQVVYHEEQRCALCYTMRLKRTAAYAQAHGFPFFTSTLLVSPYQNHDLIVQIGQKLGQDYGVTFLAEDFRPGYREAVRISKELGMYRQPYCGCIYSEKDRYYRKNKGGTA